MQPTLTVVSALLVALPCLFGQFGSGIQGTIIDKTGGVILNAQVEVTNLATAVSWNALTSDAGVLRVLSLGGGVYSVRSRRKVFSPPSSSRWNSRQTRSKRWIWY
jgi:hypothetical protein